jgi:hypothetical protein
LITLGAEINMTPKSDKPVLLIHILEQADQQFFMLEKDLLVIALPTPVTQALHQHLQQSRNWVLGAAGQLQKRQNVTLAPAMGEDLQLKLGEIAKGGDYDVTCVRVDSFLASAHAIIQQNPMTEFIEAPRLLSVLPGKSKVPPGITAGASFLPGHSHVPVEVKATSKA